MSPAAQSNDRRGRILEKKSGYVPSNIGHPYGDIGATNFVKLDKTAISERCLKMKRSVSVSSKRFDVRTCE